MHLEDIIKEAKNLQIGEYNFECPSIEMLDVNENNYLESLSKHPAAIAYYGTLFRESQRDLENMEMFYKNRYAEMYGECSNILGSTKNVKFTQKDVEALIRTKYGKELNDLENKIKNLKKNKDVFEMFYEGWKAKSFVLGSYTNLVMSGFIQPKQSIVEDESSSSFSIKDYLKKRIKDND